MEFEAVRFGVDGDRIAFVDQRDRRRRRRLPGRRGRPPGRACRPENRPSVIRPTESPRPAPMSAEVGSQHFAHAGTALRALRSGSRSRRRDGFGSRGWRPGRSSSESKTRAGPVIFSDLGNFGDGAFAREIASQNHQVALRSDGLFPRMNDVLILAAARRERLPAFRRWSCR